MLPHLVRSGADRHGFDPGWVGASCSCSGGLNRSLGRCRGGWRSDLPVYAYGLLRSLIDHLEIVKRDTDLHRLIGRVWCNFGTLSFKVFNGYKLAGECAAQHFSNLPTMQ